jgi:hypothetical protein
MSEPETIGDIVNQSVQVATHLTCGDFDTEVKACNAFDWIIGQSELFRVYREVEGRYVGGRPSVEDKQPRIDRILVPTKEVIDAGWKHGPIAVEIKKSGVPLGRVVAQSLDYANAVFQIQPGFHIWCEWLFIFPLDPPKSDVESIMAQFRIGWCSPFLPNSELDFGTGATRGIKLASDGRVQCKSLPQGRKRGHR